MISGRHIDMLLNEAPIDLFFSAKDCGVIDWPWRMNGAHQARQVHVDAADYYILDSAFQQVDTRMDAVLEKADELGVDMVALVDIEGSREQTVDSILKSREKVDDSSFEGDVMVPLQPPHAECYKELEGVGDWYGIGGLSKAPPSEKLEAAHSLREQCGEDIHLHGLGWGISDSVAREIRENPSLIDSVDSRGEYEKAMREHIDATWPASAKSSGRTAVMSSLALGYLLEALRRMNPDLTNDPAETSHEVNQSVNW